MFLEKITRDVGPTPAAPADTVAVRPAGHVSLLSFFRPVSLEEFHDQSAAVSTPPVETGLASVAATWARRRALEKERQKQCRDRTKAMQIGKGLRDPQGRLIKRNLRLLPIMSTTAPHSLAVISNKQRKLRERTTIRTHRDTEGNAVPLHTTARRINWQHPIFWAPIDAMAHRVGLQNPSLIVTGLRQQYSMTGTYNTLARGTVSNWIEKFVIPRRWKDSVLQRVEDGNCWKAGRPRASFLDDYPELVEAIIKALKGLRIVGLGVNASIAQNLIIGFISEHEPVMLQLRAATTSEDQPVLSIHTVRTFLRAKLNWTVRAGTKASQKISATWEEDCTKTFFRIMLTISNENIHITLVINVDQTGITLVPGGSQRTYEEKGAKQVCIHGKDEKRAFTGVLATSLNGYVLPTQSVWKGKTGRSLPSLDPGSSERAAAEAKYHRFVNNPTKHWSNLETTKLWFLDILFPYRLRTLAKHNLPFTAKMIIYLDCSAVHRSAALRAWLKQFGFLVLIFVPANCTSLFQPCDVGLQRVFKQVIWQEAGKFFQAGVEAQVKSGLPDNQIDVVGDLPTLRDQTPGWLMKSIEHLNTRPALVRKAWSNCITSDSKLNLSFECLTSQDAMRAFLATSAEYQAEIRGSSTEAAAESESEDDEGDPLDREIEDEEDVDLEILETAVSTPPTPPPTRRTTRAKTYAALLVAGKPAPVPREAARPPAGDLPPGYRRSIRYGGRGAVSYREPDTDEEEQEVEDEDSLSPSETDFTSLETDSDCL